jgi:hypothetical protein
MQAFLGERRLRALDQIINFDYYQQPKEDFSISLIGAKW